MDRTQAGWVPEQLIQAKEKFRLMIEDYSAKELNVDRGEKLVGLRELNGWIWCQKESSGEVGWVPKENMQSIP